MFYKNNNTLKKIIEISLFSYMMLFLSTIFTTLNLLRYSIIVNSSRLIGLILIIFSVLFFINDKKDNKYIIHVLFFILSLFALISVILSDNIYFAFYGANENNFSINYNDGYLTLISYFGFFMGSFTLSSKSIYRFLNIFSFYSYFIGLIGLFSNYLHKFNISEIISIKTSLFFNSNHYGYFLTLALFISIYNMFKKNIVIHSLGFIVLTLSIIYTNSRGAMLAVTISLLVYLVFIHIYKHLKNKYSYLPFVFLIITTLSINIMDNNISTKDRIHSVYDDANSIINKEEGSDASGSGRWKLWKDGFNLFTEKPLFGQGINAVYYDDETNFNIIRVHNEYLEYLFTYGVIYFIIYLLTLLIIGLEFLKNIKTKTQLELLMALSILAYLISAFFGNTKPYTTPYFYIFLGFLHSLTIKTKNNIITTKE